MTSASQETPRRPDRIAAFIRARRRHLDWSLARLATASGLQSPSYVFHIENESKVPSEAVARRIARALTLDEELLVAWARARGRGDLASTLAAVAYLRDWLERHDDDAGQGASGGAPEPVHRAGPAGALDTGTLRVPLLADGADPAGEPLRVLDHLELPRSQFPPLAADARLAAYRLSAHSARRAADELRPGDQVVIVVGEDAPGRDALVAVRAAGRVEIVRRTADVPAQAVAGRVVLLVRRWL